MSNNKFNSYETSVCAMQHHRHLTLRTTIKCVHLLSLSDMTGTGCEYDGVLYRNGQSFKPSCKYQCVCVNGAIGCVSLCLESQPPRVWCQSPRRVKVRGQCCEQWICDEPRRGRKTAPRHAVEGRTLLG